MCYKFYFILFIGVSVGASVFTIAAMSIDRYLAIEHSMSFRKVLNRKSTIYVSLIHIIFVLCTILCIYVKIIIIIVLTIKLIESMQITQSSQKITNFIF